jgi:hypothetical protein
MTMSTPILDEAARQMSRALLIDTVQIYNVGEPVTSGINVTRSLTPVGEPVAGLVQQTTLDNAVESLTDNVYSIKVDKYTALKNGQAVKVISCQSEPDLIGKVLLLDKVSLNGLAMLRKGVAQVSEVVNQEGKESLA